jgi:hypothetical protein
MGRGYAEIRTWEAPSGNGLGKTWSGSLPSSRRRNSDGRQHCGARIGRAMRVCRNRSARPSGRRVWDTMKCMLDALQGKLDRLLVAGMNDEVRVLYFFVEGRKMLDRKPSYRNTDFRMFANWAAHIELAHNRAPHRKLLLSFEQEYLQVIQNGQKWATTPYENLSVLKTSVLDCVNSRYLMHLCKTRKRGVTLPCSIYKSSVIAP